MRKVNNRRLQVCVLQRRCCVRFREKRTKERSEKENDTERPRCKRRRGRTRGWGVLWGGLIEAGLCAAAFDILYLHDVCLAFCANIRYRRHSRALTPPHLFKHTGPPGFRRRKNGMSLGNMTGVSCGADNRRCCATVPTWPLW